MKMKKLLAVLCTVMLIPAQIGMLPVSAISTDELVPETVETENVKAAYLISSKSLSVSNSYGKLCINGNTIGVDTMKSIGFTDIEIERSKNGISGWSHAYDIDDVLNSNSNKCYINSKKVSVTSGYYYRVILNHYAKETGLFPRTQSEPNTSNAVYIG